MEPSVEKTGDWTIIPLPDQFNGGCLAAYIPILEKLVAQKVPPKILFDFSAVRYLDSTGIGALIHLYGDEKKKGGVLVCSGCSPNVIQIFKLVNLQRFIRKFPTREEAMKRAEEN